MVTFFAIMNNITFPYVKFWKVKKKEEENLESKKVLEYHEIFLES